MTESHTPPTEIHDLADDYLSGVIDADGLARLEAWLTAEPDGRAWFVRYCRMHTDLALDAKANDAGAAALHGIETTPRPPARGRKVGWAAVTAVAVLLAVGLISRFAPTDSPVTDPEIAWLVNAQNCRWADGGEPTGAMRPGERIALRDGLAELRFLGGANVIVEGPAELELLSADSARLHSGRLTARVTEPAEGFTVISPHGKIIDMGTEFGVSVGEDGSTDVVVFSGEVVADAVAGDGPLHLTENEAANLDDRGIRPGAADARPFHRQIADDVPRPRMLRIDFTGSVPGTLCDAAGTETGLTHRLPGTGERLQAHDPNMRLDPGRERLAVTTTDSDLNGQRKMDTGEYFGFRLADHGFTGDEDFEISAEFEDVPDLERIGQFGLYAGPRSDANVRGGLISLSKRERAELGGTYRLFLVKNRDGRDFGSRFVGLASTGDNVRMTLKRSGDRYAYTVENVTDKTSFTLAFPEPEHLKGRGDTFVGLFAANTFSDVRRTLWVSDVKVTVWIKPETAHHER